MKQGPEQFEQLADAAPTGRCGSHIDRIFPLEQVPEALAYVGEGRALGKVVIAIDPSAT